jgi:hypothetical protein
MTRDMATLINLIIIRTNMVVRTQFKRKIWLRQVLWKLESIPKMNSCLQYGIYQVFCL